MNWQTMDSVRPHGDDYETQCLVYGPEIGVKIGRAWKYADGDVFADACGFHGDWLITHWMPLPEKPVSEAKPCAT